MNKIIMKELTIDQKVKAYDEALSLMVDCVSDKDGLVYVRPEDIFSELRESEDERIRQKFIKLVKMSSEDGGFALHKWEADEMLAWLEKQRKSKCTEDERIRKIIINHLTQERGSLSNEEVSDAMSWLEKQGEFDETKTKIFFINKGYPIDANGVFPTYEEMYNIIREGIEKQGDNDWGEGDVVRHGGILALVTNGRNAIKSNLERITIQYPDEWVKVHTEERKYFFEEFEKQVEKKYTDGILTVTNYDKLYQNCKLPKFKVGDWVVNNTTLNLCYILKVEHGQYICDDCSFPITKENEYRLWTIQDAKPGDVLVASDDSLFILSKVVDTAAFFYFSLCKNGSKEISDGNHSWETAQFCHPATKEQCDLLFEKMKETGYEWDAEKKELKKIEYKSADESKPKFHEGDWVINRFDDNVWHIDSFDKKNYQVSDGKGNYNWFPISEQDKMRLWTINDAKDGAVLVEDSCIFIIQKLGDNSTAAKTYCTLYNDGDFDDGSILYFDIDSTKPATKEQRDALFEKMKETGYEWDAEKKELKKIVKLDKKLN